MAKDKWGGIEFTETRFRGRVPIEAYGNGGFRFANMSHRGSILILPSGFLAWSVDHVDTLSPALIEPILDETGSIEILLFGTGSEFRTLPELIQSTLKRAGLQPDLMNTGAAVRTYNVLISENRAVAAALIAVDAPR